MRASDHCFFSYEALIRGPGNEPAQDILSRIPQEERARFEEQSSLVAIQWAAHLGINTHLNLNMLPSALVASSTTVTSILHAIEAVGIGPERIILEILESDVVNDLDHLSAVLKECRSSGMHLAIDDFGAGQAGLNLLAEFQPDILKLDLRLIRGIDGMGPRQAIVRGVQRTCLDLGIEVVAEGVETESEFFWLCDEGIKLFQGYLFAKPAYEKLPTDFNAPVC